MENNTVVTENNKVKEPKTPKQKVFFALKIVGNVIFYGILILLFLWSIMNINGGARNQGFPNIFGRGFLNVATDSMSHENMINDIYKNYPEYKNYEIQGLEVGDLITSKVLDDEDRKNLKIGDVCTFYDKSLNALNTHRLVYITYNEDGSVAIYTFQGDKSVSSFGKYDPQKDPAGASQLIGSNQVQQFSGDNISNIKGLTTGVTAGGGKVLQNLQDNWLWYFVFPVVILLLVEVFLVVRNIMILRGEKNKAELAEGKEAILADEKERMRQELLAELRAQGLAPAEAPKEEVKAEPEVVVAPVVTENEPVEAEPVVEEKKVEEPVQEVVDTKEVQEELNDNEVIEETKEETTEVEPESATVEAVDEEEQTEEVAQEDSVQEEVNEETTEENTEVVEEEKADAEEVQPKVVVEPEVKEEAPKKAPAKKKTTTTGAKKSTTKTPAKTTKKATSDKPKTTTKTATKKTTTKKETK